MLINHSKPIYIEKKLLKAAKYTQKRLGMLES